MVKTKKTTVISVKSIFDGNQDGRQVFIDLILRKNHQNITNNVKSGQKSNKSLDSSTQNQYNRDKVFSDVRVS